MDARAAALADYDVLVVTRERTPLPKKLLERLPKLKFIASPEMQKHSVWTARWALSTEPSRN